MVIGGLLCRSSAAHCIAKRISDLHASQRFKETIQWKSTSEAKLPFYKSLFDLLFGLIAQREVDFSCIVFDKSKVDHATYNENNPEKGFFKFLYQHHLSHVKRYGSDCTMRCFHGNMKTKYDLSELKRCLNGGTPRKGLKVFQPYVQVEFKPVRDYRLLQLSDLMIGAVGYITNGKQRLRPFSVRTELALYAQEHCPVGSLSEPTLKPDWGFDIWHFRL